MDSGTSDGSDQDEAERDSQFGGNSDENVGVTQVSPTSRAVQAVAGRPSGGTAGLSSIVGAGFNAGLAGLSQMAGAVVGKFGPSGNGAGQQAGPNSGMGPHTDSASSASMGGGGPRKYGGPVNGAAAPSPAGPAAPVNGSANPAPGSQVPQPGTEAGEDGQEAPGEDQGPREATADELAEWR